MHEFLNSIADAYIADPDLRSYTFVFPNVRSKRYFHEYVAAKIGVEPQEISAMFLTLTHLMEVASGMRQAKPEKMLFMLYRAYRDARGNNDATESFDRFRFWGKMLLQDFNDVDKYLADPHELFRNASDYKKIQSFYLTAEQEEIIKSYWGSDPYWKSAFKNRDAAGQDLPFWNHVTMKGEPERKFTQLWALLGNIYDRFHLMLAEHNECYPGMAFRKVAETLLRGGDLRLKPRKFVFIGFNRLSHAEHALFQQLALRNQAHFYWDFDPALMNHRNANTAGRFISTYIKEFSACHPGVNLPPHPASHEVNIIAVPSEVAMTKIAGNELRGNETALVLADSELLVPTVASIPENYDKINVTMGYPMRFSALSQLFSVLTAMQRRARADETGLPVFFHDDIIALISHPLVQIAFPAECASLPEMMRSKHLFNLPLASLPPEFDALMPLLGSLAPDADAFEIKAYVTRLLDYASDSGMITGIDLKCAESLRELVDDIAGYCSDYGISTNRHTIFEMIEHMLQTRTLPLEGKSFDAMQVMGVLETRALGFPNVVMLSMNDDIFPGTEHSRSFIPEALRHAYGLPTRDHVEVDSAYHFYRILSHARHLTLIYDARCSGTRTGQESRYLTQLRYGEFPGVKVNSRLASFKLPLKAKTALIADDYQLDKSIFAGKLECFADPEQLKGYRLSASNLKTYLNCPLEFFLAKINDIDPPEAINEETGAADHGNVIHTVAERIYKFFGRRGGPVTAADLESLLAGGFDNLLERELRRAVNLHFMHYPETIDGHENTALEQIPLDDKNSIYADALRLSIHRMFRRETTPFTIVGTEIPVAFSWKISDSLSVNFKMIIDRLDTVAEGNSTVYRIVDYKTGADETSFPSVESLFEIGSVAPRRAVFQLLVYCEALLQIRPEIEARNLRPMIFRLKDMHEADFPMLRIGSQTKGVELENYQMVRDEFKQNLTQMFADIFNPGLPVVRATDPKSCTFCNFNMLCRKY